MAGITAPKMREKSFKIRGTVPYVSHKFATSSKQKIKETQEKGSQGKKGTKREPRDFERDFQEATHRDVKEGWPGMAASAFRCAMISACRLVGFKMTIAKLSVFVEADGYDDGGIPLVRIDQEPEMHIQEARLETGVISLACRPMWKPGWTATVRMRYDADQFSEEDVTALMQRVGMQVGLGEGRPDSKRSTGVGWGLFEIVTE